MSINIKGLTNFGPHIVTDGLVLYLDGLNSKSFTNSNTTNDLSKIYVNTWDLLGNSVSYNENYYAFEFSNDIYAKFIRTSNSFSFNYNTTNAISYDFWCYLTGDITGDLPSLFYDRGQGVNPFVWIYEDDSNNLRIQYSDSTQIRAQTVCPSVKDIWRNVTITFQYGLAEETHICSYVNGVKILDVYPNRISLFPSEISTKTIGNYSTINNHNWRGYMGPVKVYNKMLSPSEVLQNFNALKSRYLL